MDRHDHNIGWDGDFSKLTDAQLNQCLAYFEAAAAQPVLPVLAVPAIAVLAEETSTGSEACQPSSPMEHPTP